jgi:hypothetical protein
MMMKSLKFKFELKVGGLGSRVKGSGFGVWGLVLKVMGLGFRV